MRTPSLLLLSVPAFCVANESGPLITVDNAHINLGKVYGGNKVPCRFRIRNVGQANLTIKKVAPSCGCTSTFIRTTVLAPGEGTEIEVIFNPAGFTGNISKSIAIFSDDPVQPEIKCTFDANIVFDYTISSSTALFDDITRHEIRNISVALRQGNGELITVKSVTSEAPYISGAIRSIGAVTYIDITLDSHMLPTGMTRGNSKVIINTDSEQAPSTVVAIQWNIRPLVTANPPRAIWIEKAGKDLRQKIVLKGVDGYLFRIIACRTTTSLVRVEGLDSMRPKRSTQECQVVFSGTAKPGTYDEKVFLTIDDSEHTELSIRVAAVIR